MTDFNLEYLLRAEKRDAQIEDLKLELGLAKRDLVVFREALEGVVWQFGFWVVNTHTAGLPGKRRLSITTGGYSDLEQAFRVLGWDDPHFAEEVDECGCHWDGCVEHATCGQSLPEAALGLTEWPASCLDRQQPYARVCSSHMAVLHRLEQTTGILPNSEQRRIMLDKK